jgi:hypothetical protein
MSEASSRVSAASSSASKGRGSRSSGRSRSTPTVGPSSNGASRGRTGSRTCGRSERGRSTRSTSSAGASPARTCPPPEREPGSVEPARVFGASSPASFASYDPATSSWRTSRRSSPGRANAGRGRRSEEFSETWPRSGMTRSGRSYPLESSGHRIYESGSGSLPIPPGTSFPTPSAKEPDTWRYVEVVDKDGRPPAHPNQRFYDKKTGRIVQKTLEHIALTWPTPHGMPKRGQRRRPGPSGNELGRAVLAAERERLPTPLASEAAHPGRNAPREAGQQRGLAEAAGIEQLNPAWVEWLMGFPTGWTALRRSETPSSLRLPSGSGDGSSSMRRRRR